MKEVAKFLSGFEAFHTLFHGYLLATGTEMTMLGIIATPTVSFFAAVVNAGVAMGLGWYGWRKN